MSLHVRLVFLANFRETVGKREIIEEINSNVTLKNIVDKLAGKYGSDFKQIVDPGTWTISLQFLVSINGRIVRDANVKLNNGDIVMFSIPVGGG